MVTPINSTESAGLDVVHSQDDAPEEKRSAKGLGYIHMSGRVKASLITLRF